ncbi:MAG: hypothetical protein WCJ33_07730 [Pseudomonadota bacterium]
MEGVEDVESGGGGGGGEDDISPDAVNTASDVVDAASAEMSSIASENAVTSTEVNMFTEKRLEAVDKSLEAIKTTIGLDVTVGDALTDIDDGKVTEGATKFKNWLSKITGKIKDYVKKIQAKNGEAGETLENSPKTIKQFMEKHGVKIAVILVLGVILSSNLLRISGASQCFQMPTCGNGGPVTPISCSKEYCNCASISSCASYPACDQPATNCMYYYYQTMDVKTIIATIPYIAYTTYLAAQPPKSETLKKILILLGILIIGCSVIFMIYKLSNK